MRLPLSRATALVAILTALVTACGFAQVRTGSGGRDRTLRITRAGSPRLESPDGPIHCHESTDVVSVPAGDLIDTSGHADAAPPGLPESTPTAVLPAPCSFTAARLPTDLRPKARRPVLVPAEPKLHAPDRAPPAA
jgi:hypothetical protein